MPERLIIIGCGAQARYILNTVSLTNGPEIIGLVDTFDNPSIWGNVIDHARVLGNLDALKKYPPIADLQVITAIADLDMKHRVVDQLMTTGYTFYSAIHPSACIAGHVTIGVGTIINAHAVIETGTIIGNHVIIHAGCVVEHDNVLEDFVNLGPGVVTAGRVRVKNGAVIFTGASIIPDVVVGENAVVGAGAVVIKSVAPDSRVVGIPARQINLRKGQ